MKTCIVYYSLNGNTENTAEKLAKLLDADLVKLEPRTEYPVKGFRKFFVGGKSALHEETPALKPYVFDAKKYDAILFGYPVWASNVTPPVRTFIAENRGAIFGKKIGVFACQAGNGAEKTFERLALTLGLDSVPSTLVLNDPLRKPSEANEEKIRRFAESFRD